MGIFVCDMQGTRLKNLEAHCFPFDGLKKTYVKVDSCWHVFLLSNHFLFVISFIHSEFSLNILFNVSWD